MIITILLLILIICYSLFLIIKGIKNTLVAKKNGTPLSCSCCPSNKSCSNYTCKHK